MATTTFNQQQHNHVYNHGYTNHRPTYSHYRFSLPEQNTPPSSAASPTNILYPAKQITQRRACGDGYVPAALRPADMGGMKGSRPLTPPRSAQGSLESTTSRSTISGSKSLPVTPIDDASSFMAPLNLVRKVVTDEWHEELGDVTGAPHRGHWRPDSTASCCTSPTCSTVFTFLARRHHCRRCGYIFCNTHSNRLVPLDQEARFHPQGVLARACDNCMNDYGIWQRDRKSRASSIASGGTATPPIVAPFVPDNAHEPIRGADYLGVEPRKRRESNHGTGESVKDTDWNWSTF